MTYYKEVLHIQVCRHNVAAAQRLFFSQNYIPPPYTEATERNPMRGEDDRVQDFPVCLPLACRSANILSASALPAFL